jgi:hypothetical protein
MGYGGWMGVGILPLLWRYTKNNVIRAAMAILSPAMCSLATTSIFVLFYMSAYFVLNVGKVMTSPVFLLSSMGTVCIAVISVAMYFALPLYMSKTEESQSESQDEEESQSESQDEEESQSESDNSHSGSQDDVSVSDAESTDIEPDNSWREEANFDGLRTAPELPA